ncbi:MAG: hypothetical protein GKR90_22470 [Pseudomonadales bacterium]|nr:hypothetical protein [Pseudomonadales bacterium]
MDIQSTAELLGNLGEFIASIAVLITLIYLAVQIKQNTKAMHVTARGHIVEGTQHLRGLLMNNEFVRGALVKQHRGGELSDEEKLVLRHYTVTMFRNWEYQHYQFTNGLVDQDSFRATQVVWRVSLSPYNIKLWPKVRDQFTEVFAQELERVMAATEKSEEQ